MNSMEELEGEYFRKANLLMWKIEELMIYLKYVGSDSDVQKLAMKKIQTITQYMKKLNQSILDLLKTDMGKLFTAELDNRKKFQRIKKEVESCAQCLEYKMERDPIFCLANEAYFWIVQYGELSIDPQPNSLKKRMKTLSARQREALRRLQHHEHSCKLTRTLIDALNHY